MAITGIEHTKEVAVFRAANVGKGLVSACNFSARYHLERLGSAADGIRLRSEKPRRESNKQTGEESHQPAK